VGLTAVRVVSAVPFTKLASAVAGAAARPSVCVVVVELLVPAAMIEEAESSRTGNHRRARLVDAIEQHGVCRQRVGCIRFTTARTGFRLSNGDNGWSLSPRH